MSTGGDSPTEGSAVGLGWDAELLAEVAAERRRGAHTRPRRDLLDTQVRGLQQFLCAPHPLGQQPAQRAHPSYRVEVPRETFLVEVVARSGGVERRAVASGRDIYAVTAPLVVEAAFRILAGAGDTVGVASVGARFDAKDFLSSLSPQHLALG